MDYKIFILCLRQLLLNWRTAIRISWFWLLVASLPIIFLVITNPSLVDAFDVANKTTDAAEIDLSAPKMNPTNFFIGAIASMILSVVAFCTIAIAWHRFILREEVPDKFYILNREWPIGKYFWNSLKISFAIIPIIFLFLILFTFFILPILATPGSSLLLPIILLIQIFSRSLFTWLLLRLGIILPAIAVGKSLSFGESFRLTAKIRNELAITALLMVLFQFLPLIFMLSVSIFSGPVAVWIALPINLLFSWISFFIGFGVLTVIYGHLVENRPI